MRSLWCWAFGIWSAVMGDFMLADMLLLVGIGFMEMDKP
jgi:hypothetical protein